MIVGVGEHARDDAALLGDAEALFVAQGFEIDLARHSHDVMPYRAGAKGDRLATRTLLSRYRTNAALARSPSRPPNAIILWVVGRGSGPGPQQISASCGASSWCRARSSSRACGAAPHSWARPSDSRRAGSTSDDIVRGRSEEHTSELQSLMRISYAVFCLKKKNKIIHTLNTYTMPASE